MESLERILELYREAAYTDVTMEGVHFMGVNRSRYREAWEADRKEFFNSKKKEDDSKT
ncbi:hypothetical protein EVB79_061 [Rhizobium phage RHph_N3_13]|nr:hypothetical protein EVB79_061 [Rhizobium phage RHph_N3_13]QIG69887.1 hypothetical protein F67_I3_11_061 [Rhizobium phage RHph_I3_11]